MVQTVRRTIVSPQLHVHKVIDAPVMLVVRVPQVVIIPVATPRLIPMVSLTMEIPHVPGVKVCELAGPCAEAQGQG